VASDDDRGGDGRNETAAERQDRNWNELLQELRVTQTGVQLLTGLLLTLPFQQRFALLDGVAKGVYLAAVIAAVSSTALLIAPVAFHRLLFRHGAKDWLVSHGNVSAMAGLAGLMLASTGALWLIFDVVVNRLTACVVFFAAVAAITMLWWAVPLSQRRADR
jgi:Family of unknown function (DUF6328)